MTNDWAVLWMIVIFFIMNVVLMNLLIAIMSNTCKKYGVSLLLLLVIEKRNSECGETCCADEKVQEKVKLQSMLDLYSITMENSRYSTALPPPFNVIGLLYQLFKFWRQYPHIKAFWPKSGRRKRFDQFLSRNKSDFKHRDYPSLEVDKKFRELEEKGCEDKAPSEEHTEEDKRGAQDLHLFMENARKDYLAELRGENEAGVEDRVTHMQKTVVHILEVKIEDRIQKIQDKLEQCFPADKEKIVRHIEDGREKFAVCGYLTDVEANFDYFERYLAISQIIGWADEESTYVPNVKRLKFKRDDAIFVFGGDSQDKGIGDIRFTKLMLELRHNYPDRVEFIIGNRDANKLRLGTELHEDAIEDPNVLTDKSFPYWEHEDKRCTPQMFLDQNKAENGGSDNTAANRLRWILDKNMGAPGAFERRRHELSILRAVEKTDITDEHVVASYRDEVDPAATDNKNFMLKYLQHGKLAFVFGSNLFLHGAITEHNKGRVPGAKEPMEKVHDWVGALNAWAKSEVEAFEKDPHGHAKKKPGAPENSSFFSGIYTDRKGGGLMDYGVPSGDGVGGGGDKTVVYANFLDNAETPLFFKNNAKHISPEVQEYLLKSKVKTVVTGHQPHGDCPCVIRSGAVTVITADTSIGQKGYKSKWGHDDDRGQGPPVSEVLVYADGTSEVHGVLLDGTKIAYKLGVGGDKYVGRQLSDGYWVKAKIAQGKDRTDYNSPLPVDGTTEENCKIAEDSASELRLLDRFDALEARLDRIESEPEYVIAAMDGFAYKTRRMKLSELESLTDAHFVFQSCHDEDLARAGVDSAFHGLLISAGLDIDTLKMAADDRRYLASELKEAGISKPGGKISQKVSSTMISYV